jgi:hypothetical protein
MAAKRKPLASAEGFSLRIQPHMKDIHKGNIPTFNNYFMLRRFVISSIRAATPKCMAKIYYLPYQLRMNSYSPPRIPL